MYYATISVPAALSIISLGLAWHFYRSGKARFWAELTQDHRLGGFKWFPYTGDLSEPFDGVITIWAWQDHDHPVCLTFSGLYPPAMQMAQKLAAHGRVDTIKCRPFFSQNEKYIMTRSAMQHD